MSKKRESVSDYPEHLNPFYEGKEKAHFWNSGKLKRSNSFGESIRNALLFKSFRSSKKNKQNVEPSPLEIRKHHHTTEYVHQRQTLPPTFPPSDTIRRTEIPLLPRSRFSERVAMSNSKQNNEHFLNGSVNALTPVENSVTLNPFEEKKKVEMVNGKRLRRRKKRAPPPPTIREDGTYLTVSSNHSLSEWSLTSVDTDFSNYSENEQQHLDSMKEDMQEIINITKELEKMTDCTNNNTIHSTNADNDDSIIFDHSALITSSREHLDVIIVTGADNEKNRNPISQMVYEIIEEQINDTLDKYELDKVENSENNTENSSMEVLYNTSYSISSCSATQNHSDEAGVHLTTSNSINISSNSITSKEPNDEDDSPQSPKCKTEINMVLHNNTITE